MKHSIAAIQYITQDSEMYSHSDQALMMFENGVKWVQIRMKNSSKEEVVAESKVALAYANRYDATLIVNDSVEIAKEIGAHGVHLGLKDVSIKEARGILGDDLIIGGTANTIKDIEYHTEQGADYIGLGPFRFTSTKNNLSPILGLDGYKKIIKQVEKLDKQLPIVAVGGIQLDDIHTIKSAGIFGVAVSSALLEKYGKKNKE